MRIYVLAALVAAAAGFAIGAAVVGLDRPAPAPRAGATPPVTSGPARGGEATASPAQSAPASEAWQAQQTLEARPAAPLATAQATPPAKPPGSDLPNVDVAPRIVHTVPD